MTQVHGLHGLQRGVPVEAHDELRDLHATELVDEVLVVEIVLKVRQDLLPGGELGFRYSSLVGVDLGSRRGTITRVRGSTDRRQRQMKRYLSTLLVLRREEISTYSCYYTSML